MTVIATENIVIQALLTNIRGWNLCIWINDLLLSLASDFCETDALDIARGIVDSHNDGVTV